jgi:hypothetical protein
MYNFSSYTFIYWSHARHTAHISVISIIIIIVKQRETELLNAVSYTGNGKNASPSQQKQILSLVENLEKSNPPKSDLLTNDKSLKALGGLWYLQYTSPGRIEDGGDDNTLSSVNSGSEEEMKQSVTLTENKFKAKGSVKAGGLTVDVSNRTPKQIIDIENGMFFNEVDLDFGSVKVGGPFTPSSDVSNSK